jgi:hypothetical protein
MLYFNSPILKFFPKDVLAVALFGYCFFRYSEKDTHNAFNASTGVFTAPRSGTLRVDVITLTNLTLLATNQRYVTVVRRDGAQVLAGTRSNGNGASTNHTSIVSGTFLVTKGQMIDVFGTSQVATNLAASPVSNKISLELE